MSEKFTYKIDEIRFSDGTCIQPSALTVIVGPNNSGKSRALRDIETLITGRSRPRVVVTGLSHSMPRDVCEFREAYKVEPHTDQNNSIFFGCLSSNLTTRHRVHIGHDWEEELGKHLSLQNDHARVILASWFGNMFVSMFSTEDRLKLVKESESALPDDAESLLQALYVEGREVEDEIRLIFQEAFQKDIRLDYSALRKLLLRIGNDLSSAPADGRDALGYYKTVEKLDDQGDGMRSFIATLITLFVGKRPVLLLDEPEAFLHPPQAFRLGEVIAQQSSADRQVIVATHSSELLRGILSQRQDVTILRVNRIEEKSDVKILSSKDVALFANDPLLSSTRILDGIFYKGAIIVEADADAVFYQRIGRQLSGADNYHFAHAHNKQTVARVLAPYLSLGIRYAAIVDFDIIRVKSEFISLVEKFKFSKEDTLALDKLRSKIVEYVEKVPPAELLEKVLDSLRKKIAAVESDSQNADLKLSKLLADLKKVRESGTAWEIYKKKGRLALDDAGREAFDELWKICASKGLFIVPIGELEGWMEQHDLPHTSNKSKWIVAALQHIPKLAPNVSLEPWSFLSSVFNYLGNTATPELEEGALASA